MKEVVWAKEQHVQRFMMEKVRSIPGAKRSRNGCITEPGREWYGGEAETTSPGVF